MSAEEALQADYAANGAGMTLDAFVASKMNDLQMAARNGWLRSGSNPHFNTVASPQALGGNVLYRIDNYPD